MGDLVSDSLASVIALVFGYLLLRHQARGLARLLGARSDRRIVLVLPDMRVKPGGTEGSYRQRGYVGPAVTRCEFEAAVAVRDALADPLTRLLGRQRGDRAGRRIGESGPVEGTELCPPASELQEALLTGSFRGLPREIANRSLVLFGGPVYNSLTQVAFKHSACLMVPELRSGGEWGVLVKAGPQANEFFSGRDAPTSRELAIIQSLPMDTRDGPTVTVCAGTGDIATLASANYLLANWRRIARKTGDKPYAVLLSVDPSTGSTRWMLAVSDGQAFVL